jgi:hypothetical protein
MTVDPTDTDERPDETHEFSATGYVIERSGRREVYVGGALIGWFDDEDIGMRNVLLIAAGRAARVNLAKLAKAFGISAVMGRKIRQKFGQQGLKAIVHSKRGGRERKLTPKLQARLDRLFDKGLMIDEVHEKIHRSVSRTLVGRAHKCWIDAKNARAAEAQQRAVGVASTPTDAPEATAPSCEEASTVVVARERRASTGPMTPVGPVEQRPEERRADEFVIQGEDPASVFGGSGQPVQHLGTWLMIAMVHALGVYRIAEVLRQREEALAGTGKQCMKAATLRLAIGAVVIALSLGQQTVEGVRRIGTPSLPILLRMRRRGPLSASWTRRILGHFAEKHAESFRLAVATTLVQQNEEHAGAVKRVVFYIDNHLRPYTGKHKIRKGWRMQSKRAVPGNADFWVHDEDGRPVLRMDSPEHESLVPWLRRIGRLIREALKDEDVKVLLVFDRAGAYPQELAQLRDEGFEFATYERGPYAKIAASAYDREIELGEELYGLAEVHNKNLGKARGRVRRICLRTPDDEQVNVLAVSEASAEQVVNYMTRRWACQENQFKHGVERWGINQLDGRSVEPYPPDAIIPNPARARVERALRLARAAEGEALRRLQAMEPNDLKRERVERDLGRSRRQQQEFLEIRPLVPKHAPVKETELSGVLMRHRQRYKHTVDAIRIALSNAEAELAARLAPLLPRPAEAKRTLGNLLGAPGTVVEGLDTIEITLAPAGTSSEQRSFQRFLGQVNELPLSLPGDAGYRRLRFQVIAQ